MPPKPSSLPSNRALPPKESGLFRELLQHYETRQLKKGLKVADTILKKFPDHGETLCMKGLMLTHQGRKEEGKELAKKGIRLDLTSHIVWHVFGLIQKGERDYEGALKSYGQALKFEKDNQNILRDAAHIQTQLRLYDALLETRHLLLRLRPNLRQNWVGLAVAYHLHGELDGARKVLELHERMLKNVPEHDFEHSELLLYHIRILDEMKHHQQALDLLEYHASKGTLTDRVAIMDWRARLLLALDSKEKAETAWRELINHNPDCPDYYKRLLCCKGISLEGGSDSERAEALTILRGFMQEYPSADSPRQLALIVSSGETFYTIMKDCLIRGLHKGIPSLFTYTKALYSDVDKRTTIESIVEGFREKAESGHPISDETFLPSGSDAPTTYLWTLFFLAQHYSFLGRHEHALSLVSKALAHTPTLPELHTLKGRILKRLGDPYGAAESVDDARLLDGQDRFLNTKSAKYRLRIGQVEQAQEILSLFTKKDASSPGADLEDMQSLLYLIEAGHAECQRGKLNLALKRYHSVIETFNDFEDDQYDFHGYSVRRSIVNIYLNMLDWADHLRSHPAYIAAVLGSVEIYIKIHDDPSLAKEPPASELSELEKKAKKKAKKAAQKAQEATKHVTSINKNDDTEVTPPKDEDPDGMKLLTDPAPLERAWKALTPLRDHASNNIDVWIAVYDVSVRRGKILQAIQALTRLKTLDPEHAELHVRTLHLHRTYTSAADSAKPWSKIIMEAFTALSPPGTELSFGLFNTQYLQRHGSDARAVLGAARGAHILNSPRDEVEGILFSSLNEGVSLDLKTALSISRFLSEINSPRVDEFRKSSDARFKLSTVFKTPEERATTSKYTTSEEVVEVLT